MVSAKDLETLDATAIAAGLPTFDATTLEALIRRTNHEYWVLNAPSIPDPLYDRLVESLRALEPGNPVLEELGEEVPAGEALAAEATHDIAPEQRLGAPVRHTEAMLSLAKCYGSEELASWAAKFTGAILVMPKMDGIACSLRYDDRGRLYLAATRGNGREGEDITVNVLEVADIPHVIAADVAHTGNLALEVRGELFMRLSVFERFSGQFSNPRNLTAGAIKHKERGKAKAYELSFFAYDVLGRPFAHEREKIELLTALGFTAEEFELVDRDELQAAYERWAQRRSKLDYEIDGVVYRAADVGEQQRLGATGHHPRWSIAYKFQGDSGITRLCDVQWTVSRTGTITPGAVLEPIKLSGAMIGKSSLHNLTRFDELALTRGALVEVTRRGGVIPNVERVVEPGPGGERFAVPDRCPACGGPVERRRKRDGEFLYCRRPESCIHARLGTLQHFAKVVDIQGFGPKVIQQAIAAGLLTTPADYYTLAVDELEQLERMGRRSAQNLIEQIDAHRRIDLPVFLRALGIAHLGERNAQRLAQTFGSFANVRVLTRETLMSVAGIKDAIADAILAGLAERRPLIDDLLSRVTVTDADGPDRAEPAAGPVAGKSFLFTGALEGFTRKQAEDRVRAAGGTVASTVTKTLDYLVVGAGQGPKSSKHKKAEQLCSSGAPLQIISEAEFLALLERA